MEYEYKGFKYTIHEYDAAFMTCIYAYKQLTHTYYKCELGNSNAYGYKKYQVIQRVKDTIDRLILLMEEQELDPFDPKYD